MTALASSSGVRMLAATGVHLDRWCESQPSVSVRSSGPVELATALIWIRPNPDHSHRARWGVQIDNEAPFVCEIEQDRPTYVGFTVSRDANCTFTMDFHCDYLVTDSGADKRELSFVLSRLALCADDVFPSPDEASEMSGFGEFIWTDEGGLKGRLYGASAPECVEAFINGEKIAEAMTDHAGAFLLQVSDTVAGHSPRRINIAAGEVSIEIDVVLDPMAIGKIRADLPLPSPPQIGGRETNDGVAVMNSLTVPVPAPGGHDYTPLAPLLETMAVQTQALRALLSQSAGAASAAAPAAPVPIQVSDRYGPLFDMAASSRAWAHDIIFLGVIDWDFRVQRPQHIATDLARRGNRVFYISIVFGSADSQGRFQILKSPELGVYEIRLKLNCAPPESIYRRLEPRIVSEILAALDEMLAVLSINSPMVIVEYPSWAPVAFGIPGATVVHDCLDLVSGFENTPAEIIELEEELVASADVLVTASGPLSRHLAETRQSTIIRNGADVEFFATAATRKQRSPYPGKVIGYFGAIAHWFDAEWIVSAAEANADWTIVLIGAADAAHVRKFAKYSNIVLLGERPYAELVEHLAYFDVAVIPFKLVDLILCTNPVKLYEYMAAGKPVVASAMPEVVQATDLVYIAKNPDDFVVQVERAITEDSDRLRASRMKWAQKHSWASRGEAFSALLEDANPKVSVVVLSYKNWEFTKATLWSILAYSDYANLEIVVVDNGSGKEIVRNLQQFASRDPRIKLVLSDRNLGYAAGNNLGLREASGEYIILLNNDTYVTRGWVRDLIRPLRLDKSIGLVSPLTNNIGNEQRITINYSDMEEMARTSRSLVRQRTRERFETECVAFFCVALRRDVLEKVGFLDEGYGLGFFEDDDYCKRTTEAGYRIQIVDDVFVHHHLSASFNQLGQQKKDELMRKNRAIFEARWGAWKPHSHRRAAGFG